ncbi:hypothetical protein P3T37_001398 [Kitasatospora sp. MAA4]|uniref:hypothetical protein n=1 Tax=Kitasatospora sp. MAA4 TaxID=3035093 RepID=UPI002473B66E|nr:hypothetical protein [Kitasatospora sp. MAA4]MDH6132013.1 hypothetical protein [Kitasatospora sp. MAA4]
MAPYLNRFYSSVGSSPWLATVEQYGAASTPDMLAGTWSDPAPVPAVPTDAQIQAEAVSAAQHFGVPTSVNTQIVVATPTGHSTAGFGGSYCGYHSAVTAMPSITYTDLPYMPDAGGSCGAGSANGTAGTLDGVSIVAGHEMAEAITDPLINGWRDSTAAEIGDKCAWVNIGNTNLSGNTFAMQPLWSNSSGGCTMGSGSWSSWQQHGVPTPGAAAGASPAVSSATSPGNGRIDLFGLGTNNNIWHKYWTPATGWTSWSPDLPALPAGIAPGSSPAASLWQPNAGEIEVYVRGKDRAIWNILYSGGRWGAWSSQGGALASNTTALSPGSNMIDLFAAGTNGSLYEKLWA